MGKPPQGGLSDHRCQRGHAPGHRLHDTVRGHAGYVGIAAGQPAGFSGAPETVVMTHLKTWMAAVLLACAPLAAVAAAPAPDGFAATFVETRTLPGFEQALTSHGVLRFSRDGGFHLEITKPYPYVFDMVDGTGRGNHSVTRRARNI